MKGKQAQQVGNRGIAGHGPFEGPSNRRGVVRRRSDRAMAHVDMLGNYIVAGVNGRLLEVTISDVASGVVPGDEAGL